jgi:hypothetical protein
MTSHVDKVYRTSDLYEIFHFDFPQNWIAIYHFVYLIYIIRMVMEKVYTSFEEAKKYKEENFPDSTLTKNGKIWDVLIVPADDSDLSKYYQLFRKKFPYVQDIDAIPLSSNGRFIVHVISFDGATITKGPIL